MKRFYQFVAVIALAIAAFTGIFQALPAQATDPSPQTISGSPKNVTLYGVISSTTGANGTGQSITQSGVTYGIADCYSNADFTSPSSGDTVTVTLQHGPALSGNYVSHTAFATQTADGAKFIEVPLYGNYIRANVDISATAALTLGVTCVYKNNAGG